MGGGSNAFSAISTCSNSVRCFAFSFTNNCRPVLTTFTAMAYKRQSKVVARWCARFAAAPS